MILWISAGILAYLVGSIPFGLVIGRLKGIDIRQHGSGNIGATNTGRVLGKKYGLLCFALDMLKGFLPVFITGYEFELFSSADNQLTPTTLSLWLAVLILAILGHVFPIWLKFKGGKGVATGLGSILGMYPYLTLPALIAFITFLIILKTFKYVSFASISAALLLPVYFIIFTQFNDWTLTQTYPIIICTTIMAILITYLHRTNITRLLNGTENKIGGSKSQSPLE